MNVLNEECPNSLNHTKAPQGYDAKQEWAFKKARRHYRTLCPECGLWKIWLRRAKDEPDYGGEPELWGMES